MSSLLWLPKLIYHCLANYVKIPIKLKISGETFDIFTIQVQKLATT